MTDVTLLPPRAFLDCAGADVNPFVSVLIVPAAEVAGTRYILSEWVDGQPHSRVIETLGYLRALDRYLPRRRGEDMPPGGDGAPILFQGEDTPHDVPSASWQSRLNWSHVRLIPDLYYFAARGYADYDPATLPWRERRAQAIWRGSTTGMIGLTEARLDELPRYRLCRTAARLGNMADIGISAVVQGTDEAMTARIRQRLTDEGLIGGFVPMERQAHAKYLVDIDGNSNAWNFMARLRLGCCVLKVSTAWTQWFSDRLEPWRHYVPVREDMADLGEQIAWCRDNDAEARWIAARGRNLAHSLDFRTEMIRAALQVFVPGR